MTDGVVSHLYLHVPFCRSICPYCDFAVTDRPAPEPRVWARALGRELEVREARGARVGPLDTLLVGGGTPSVLGVDGMTAVRSTLGEERMRSAREWSVEANPEDVTGSLVAGWVRAGVSRLNLGVQSFRGSALECLRRGHDPEDARRSIELAARSGLESWGADLLYGLPLEADPDPVESVATAIDLGVPHVSVYELTAEPDTPYGREVASGRSAPASEDLKADQYLRITHVLEAAGYEAYELTAFALPGHVSLHALAMLRGRACLGLGPGAHSRTGGHRTRNLRDWEGYLTAVSRGELPEAESGPSEEADTLLETIWFRLRSADGIPRTHLDPAQRSLGDDWVERGLARMDSGRLRLTPEGWLRLDELAIDLARAEAREYTPSSGPWRVRAPDFDTAGEGRSRHGPAGDAQ